MNPYLMERVKKDTPELNADIANGLATRDIKGAESYIDSVFKAAAKDFPPGLEYLGCRRCTPQEEFDSDNIKNTKKKVDIAKSDIYAMQYKFRYNGVDLPTRYIFLPFVRDGGAFNLGGPTFFVSPILSDIILSYEHDNIFVKLLRDKFAIRRFTHNVIIDSKVQTVAFAWASLYHFSANKAPIRTIKAYTTLVHYLVCKYGFYETLKRFADCEPHVSDEAFDTKDYPPSEWVIIRSMQQKPKTYPRAMKYLGSELRIAVKRTEFTPLVRTILGTLFYTIDHFPDRIKAEYIDNKGLWKVLLGHLIFGSFPSEGKLHDDVDEHIRSLDEYIDDIVKSRFETIGFDIDSIFEFFAIAIKDFNDWLLTANTRSNSLYTKEVSVLLDLLMPITSRIFTFHFKIKSALKKRISEKDVINAFNKHLKARSVFKLTGRINGVSNFSYSGDNKCFKITSVVVPQKSTHGASNKEAQKLNDPTKRLHVSLAEVGSFINLSDTNITGENKINPHIRLDEHGWIIRDEKKRALLDSVQAIIQRN